MMSLAFYPSLTGVGGKGGDRKKEGKEREKDPGDDGDAFFLEGGIPGEGEKKNRESCVRPPQHNVIAVFSWGRGGGKKREESHLLRILLRGKVQYGEGKKVRREGKRVLSSRPLIPSFLICMAKRGGGGSREIVRKEGRGYRTSFNPKATLDCVGKEKSYLGKKGGGGRKERALSELLAPSRR